MAYHASTPPRGSTGTGSCADRRIREPDLGIGNPAIVAALLYVKRER